MLSLQAVTLFQVVTKLINRNWFPVRFILKLLSALLVNRRKDTHYWFKLPHQQVNESINTIYLHNRLRGKQTWCMVGLKRKEPKLFPFSLVNPL